MSHIFISYSRQDMASDDGVLQRLVVLLRHNFTLWLDTASITTGTNWQEAIKTAVKGSSAMVFIMSPRSVASDWCQAEISAARAANIPIVPFVYQNAEFPFGMETTNALFYETDAQASEKLIDDLKKLAPAAFIHGDPRLVTDNLLNNQAVTFAEAAGKMPNAKQFFVTLGNDEIELAGLPLVPTAFCTSYLVGRAADTLIYRPRVQLALQFSGQYESADLPVRVAMHFLAQDRDFPLRLLLVRGPAQILYNERFDSNSLDYVLNPPSADHNQWADALHAIQTALRLLHENRENPALQIFVQGPVAGITYELGAAHRGLHYRAEHYQYDRDTQRYFRVLGNVD